MKPMFPVLGALVLGILALPSGTKPIAFAKGTTVMLEYGAGTMNEAQVFYAPLYWWSTGVGWTVLSSADGARQRHIAFIRGNLLAKRWNPPGAQANVSSSRGSPDHGQA